MIGSIGVFIATDLLTFYLVYALVSIPAYWLLADDAPASRRAARHGRTPWQPADRGRHKGAYHLAMARWRAGADHRQFRHEDGPRAPLNGWMPLTYAAAPIPAAAVLSGAAVKAGVIGLIRFLPFGFLLQGRGEALGPGLAASLSYLSAAGTALLMLHFLMRLAEPADPVAPEQTPASIFCFWPLIAVGAIFIPWLLYPAVGDLSEVLSLTRLWDGLWPLLIGAVLALGLKRWGERLPRIPEGDAVVIAEPAFRSSFALSGFFENLDARLRLFPAGGLLLVTIALLLAALAAHAE
jgi:hypothetical protein